MTLADEIALISPVECKTLLEQASRERWTELVILGPPLTLRKSKDNWPDNLKAVERIFQLRTVYPELVEKVTALSDLSTLNLWGNKLEEAEILSIAQELSGLTSLDLSFSNVSDKGAEAIAQLMPNLTSLRLALSSVSVIGVAAIASRLSKLNLLDLGNNRIGIDGALAIARSLSELRSLTLFNCDIGAEGARAIAHGLPNLACLRLYSDGIGTDATKTIATSLTKLTELFLGGNNIDDEGAETIANSLPELTKLDLGRNAIRDKGAMAIAHSLKKLRRLVLEDNLIGDDGARAITVELTQLKTLDLGYNELTDDGAIEILDVVSRRDTTDEMKKLSLVGNRNLSGALPAELLRLENEPSMLIEMYQKLRSGESFLTYSRIKRSLEFPPRYRQACTNILNYFATYLDQKYPEVEVAVEISQQGSVVRLVVETAEGDRDIVERTLEEYALVLGGRLLPEEVINDRLTLVEMRQQLDLLKLQLKWQDEHRQLLTDKAERLVADKERLNDQLEELHRSLQVGLSNNGRLIEALQVLAKSAHDSPSQICVNRLFDLVERGLTDKDEAAVKDIVEQLRDSHPATFEELIRIVRELAVGTTASLLANWIGPAFALLPKI